MKKKKILKHSKTASSKFHPDGPDLFVYQEMASFKVGELARLYVVAHVFRESDAANQKLAEFQQTSDSDVDELPELAIAKDVLPVDEKQLLNVGEGEVEFTSDDERIKSTRYVLDHLKNDQRSEKEWVRELIEYRDKAIYRHREPNIPIELQQFMAASIGIANFNQVGFIGQLSAHAILEASDTSIAIRVGSENEANFYRRIAYLAKTRCLIEVAEVDSMFEELPCNGYLCSPPLGITTRNLRAEESFPDFGRHLTAETVAVIKRCNDTANTPTAILVSSGFLLQGGSTQRVREWLVNSGKLRRVVEFPSGVFRNTFLGCAVLVINHPVKANEAGVQLVDGTQFFGSGRGVRKRSYDWDGLQNACDRGDYDDAAVAWIPMHELQDTSYELSAKRYIVGAKNSLENLAKGRKCAPLSDFAELILPRPVGRKLSDEELEQECEYQEIINSDIDDDGIIRQGTKKVIPKQGLDIERVRHWVKANDILLSIKGSIGKAGIVGEDINIDSGLLCGQTFVILRLKEDSSIKHVECLYRYLTQEVVIEYLQSLSGGSSIQFLRAGSLAELPVPLFSDKEQQEFKSNHQAIIDIVHQAEQLKLESQELHADFFNSVEDLRSGDESGD